jgi:amino acid transporter
VRAQPEALLPKRWSALDFGIYGFLAVNPLVLGLWMFSLAPLVGGNLFLAVVLAGVVMLLAATMYGALAARWPWTGGDYAWQTRLLSPRAGAVLALTSWWLVVAMLAPLYGNVVLVQVVDPVLAITGWDGLASWFHERDGRYASSLIAIALATAFVGLGMRRAAIALRVLVVVGAVAFIAVLALLLTSPPGEFTRAFDDRASELYGADGVASSQIVEIGRFDARVQEVEPLETLMLVPLLLLFGLWLGSAGPLAGEVRIRTERSFRAVLVRVAALTTLCSLLFLVALGRGTTWDLWNEVNNLYWGTVYGTEYGTPLPVWPNPVVFASWLSDSTAVQIALIAGMAAWVIGFAATLFLAATRVLLAAAADHMLPPAVGRTEGDSVPAVALGLLVVPACVLSAVDAYWNEFAGWSSVAVVPLGLTTVASGLTAIAAFRRSDRAVAVVSALFTLIVALVLGVWVLDPVYGMRSFGSLALLAALYALAGLLYAVGRHRYPGAMSEAGEARVSTAS